MRKVYQVHRIEVTKKIKEKNKMKVKTIIKTKKKTNKKTNKKTKKKKKMNKTTKVTIHHLSNRIVKINFWRKRCFLTLSIEDSGKASMILLWKDR